MAAPIHQLLAPTGCAWFFGPSDRKTHSQASSVPSKAQAKLLAEYHQAASTLTAEGLKQPPGPPSPSPTPGGPNSPEPQGKARTGRGLPS